MRSMKKWLSLALVVSLFAAACGSGSDEAETTTDPPPTTDSAPPETVAPTTTSAPETTEPPAGIVTFSEDGDLGFRVSATDADIEASVRLLDPEDWPAEIAGGDNVPGVKIYELEPDGATFDEPVTVTRRLDLDRFADLDLGPNDVPLVTMLTQNDDGAYEMLDDLSLLRVGNSLYVSATTTHFSPVITTNENMKIAYGSDGDGEPAAEAPGLDAADRQAIAKAMTRTVAVEPSFITEDDEWSDELIQELASDLWSHEAPGGPEFYPYEVNGPDGVALEREQLLVVDPFSTTAEGADFGAQRFGSRFPAVPISFAPSAATLLGDPDIEFEMTIAVLQLTVADDVLAEAIDEVTDDALSAWGFPDMVDFVYEVFHRIYGVYPSSVVKRYRNLRFPSGLVGYTTTWEGEVGPGGRLVSIGMLSQEGDDLVGEAGIECFCEYLEALLVVAGGFEPDTLDSLTAEEVFGLLQDGATDDDAEDDEALEIALALLAEPPDGADFELQTELRYLVREDEGVLFDGEASFIERLAVIP